MNWLVKAIPVDVSIETPLEIEDEWEPFAASAFLDGEYVGSVIFIRKPLRPEDVTP